MGTVDRKRIARNTLMLYFRMGFIMLVGLYTSRVVLKTLGEVDYGLYNVVGGIVVAFAFLNGVMTSACNRYFSIELGKGDSEGLRKVFNLNVTVFFGLAAVVLLLSETAGLWLLKCKMSIPDDRAAAAGWVFQFSIISLIVNMMSTPYRAIVIAREKMKVFAYSSVVEAVLKLAVVFLLVVAPFDRLIFYSALMLVVTGGVSIFYILYCRRFYRECRYSFYWDGVLFKEITGYTGWNVIGAMAGVGNNQGVNILLNMFFGAAVNAARGLAFQVYYNINLLVQNFVTASNPQITKSYASGERKEMMALVFQTSKFSYFLLFAIVLPVFIEAPAILDIWLVDVPEHSVAFVRLMLVSALVDSLGYPLATAVQATGRIKWYQILVGGSLLLTLPIVYIALKFTDCSPETVYYILIATSVCAQVLRIVFMRKLQDMDVTEYLLKVILPVIAVSVISAAVPALLSAVWDASLARALVLIPVSMALVAGAVLRFGMTSSERSHFFEMLKAGKR